MCFLGWWGEELDPLINLEEMLRTEFPMAELGLEGFGGWEQGGILFVSVCVVGRGKYIRAFSCQFRKRADFKSRTG